MVKIYGLVEVKNYMENGTVFGDLSAILIDNMPLGSLAAPSNKVSLMSDWE